MKYTADMKLGEILRMSDKVAPILMDMGLHCLGCPSAQVETIADAAMVHGLNPDDLLKRLNEEA